MLESASSSFKLCFRSLFHSANQTLFSEPCAEIACSSNGSYLCLRHRFVNNRQNNSSLPHDSTL